jgi:hypothetical protein
MGGFIIMRGLLGLFITKGFISSSLGCSIAFGLGEGESLLMLL